MCPSAEPSSCGDVTSRHESPPSRARDARASPQRGVAGGPAAGLQGCRACPAPSGEAGQGTCTGAGQQLLWASSRAQAWPILTPKLTPAGDTVDVPCVAAKFRGTGVSAAAVGEEHRTLAQPGTCGPGVISPWFTCHIAARSKASDLRSF